MQQPTAIRAPATPKRNYVLPVKGLRACWAWDRRAAGDGDGRVKLCGQRLQATRQSRVRDPCPLCAPPTRCRKINGLLVVGMVVCGGKGGTMAACLPTSAVTSRTHAVVGRIFWTNGARNVQRGTTKHVDSLWSLLQTSRCGLRFEGASEHL